MVSASGGPVVTGRLLAICLIAVWPIMAVFPRLGFVLDGRYGIVPTALIFAALGVRDRRGCPTCLDGESSTQLGVIGAPVAVWVAVLVLPYQWRIIGHHRVDPNAKSAALLSFLETNNVGYVAGSYWAILPITYVTDARIPSAVTAGFPIRYPLYQRLVEAADPSQVPFVFQPSDDDPGSLRLLPGRYEGVEVGGFIVYLPKANA